MANSYPTARERTLNRVFCAQADWPLLQLYHFVALKKDLTACVNKAKGQYVISRCLIRIFPFTHIQFRNPREKGTKETNSDLSG